MKNQYPAPLKRRVFALVYESLLVGSVALLTGLVLGIFQTFLQQQGVSPRVFPPIYGVGLLGAWWFYFKMNWGREQQTLPMRVWKIGLLAASGERASLRQLRLRFMWACVFLVFVPLLSYWVLGQVGSLKPRAMFGLSLVWWLLPWGFAWLNPRGQFLYDFLAGTELVDWRGKSGK